MEFTGELRQGFRLLWRAPGFAVTAILTLALGIGATTALFTVVNAVLLEPLPFPASNQLIQVWRSELPALTYGSASYQRYLDGRQHQRVFTDLGAWAPRGVTLAGPEGPERAPGATASASFFRVIGAAPVVGRFFSDDEANRGSNFLLSFGRLRDGMTLANARRGLADLAAQMSRDHGEDKYTFTARLRCTR